jgi:hypothetical protein
MDRPELAESPMSATRYACKAVYYGGYPGSSGKPVAGRLHWRDGALRFEAAGGGAALPAFDRARLRSVRRNEEGLTGARRVRLLVDVEAESGATVTLKFEMGGLLWKERKLARWLDILEPACRQGKGEHV